MTNPFPQMTPEKRAEALAKAAEARRARAELRNMLSLGFLTMSQLVERAETDPVAAGMKVGTAVDALHGVSKTKGREILVDLGIATDKRIRGLGDRQRENLLAAFGGTEQ